LKGIEHTFYHTSTTASEFNNTDTSKSHNIAHSESDYFDMATNTSSSDGVKENISPAEALMRKHAADEAHRATVEDTVDQDDIDHPPPSSMVSASNTAPAPTWTQPMSAKAAGKQKATESSDNSNGKSLDTSSRDLFPELGSGPKPQSTPPSAPIWGAKKPASNTVGTNGASGTSNGKASNGTSRASTPVSGVVTPNRGGFNQMSIPGKQYERYELRPEDLLPRAQLKKPVQNIVQDINKKSKANISLSTRPQGGYFVNATGPSESVRQALQDFYKQVGSKVCI
jgi:hypothetical protein